MQINGKQLQSVEKIFAILKRLDIPIEKTATGYKFLGSNVLKTPEQIIEHFNRVYNRGNYALRKNYAIYKVKKSSEKNWRNAQIQNRSMDAGYFEYQQRLRIKKAVENILRKRYNLFSQETPNSAVGYVYINEYIHGERHKVNLPVFYIPFPKTAKAKALVLAKQQGLQIADITDLGSWNGYGYKTSKEILACPVAEEIYNYLKNYQMPKRKIKSENDIIKEWASRLSKLTNIDIDSAIKIAKEKIEYKEDKIYDMEEKQSENYSRMRASLIKKMERENPLRRIKDKEHAFSILAASKRHTETDYEIQLDYARELAEIGDIDKSEVKEYARLNYNRS